MTPSAGEIATAFDHQKAMKTRLYHVEEAALAARKALKTHEVELMMSGAIIGKNAESRDAQLAAACQQERDVLEKAEAEKRSIQLAYDLASMTVDSLKWLIRAEEAGT